MYRVGALPVENAKKEALSPVIGWVARCFPSTDSAIV